MLFRLARCYDDVTEPGDVIYYPANYWHQTMTMATKNDIMSDEINKYSISLSSLLVDNVSAKNIKEALVWECSLAGNDMVSGVPRVEICEIITDCVLPEWERLGYFK